MHDLIINLTNPIVFAISFISIILIVLGVIVTLYILVIKSWLHKTDYYAQARLTLARFLLLALEFQIAADILLTVLKPSWDEFGQLAATIAIRSVLSYLLMLENKSTQGARRE